MEVKTIDRFKATSCGGSWQPDEIIVERPLLMKLQYWDEGTRCEQKISMTMRTPGADRELMVGYLFSEGILQDLQQIEKCWLEPSCAQKKADTICLSLTKDVKVDLAELERFAVMSSACGSCGKTSMDHLFHNLDELSPAKTPLKIKVKDLSLLSESFQSQLKQFPKTGGNHAAALCTPDGQVVSVFEDVGRHNALDKLIGHQILEGQIDFSESLLFLSGRISFELVQKARMAGISLIAAYGAPSSLALEIAERHDICLVGFLKSDSFNVYHGHERLSY